MKFNRGMPSVSLRDFASLLKAANPPPPHVLSAIVNLSVKTPSRRNDESTPTPAPLLAYGEQTSKRLMVNHGAGGPPSGMHLILTEMRNRFAAGSNEHAVREDSRILRDWYKRAHPRWHPPGAQSIENKSGMN